MLALNLRCGNPIKEKPITTLSEALLANTLIRSESSFDNTNDVREAIAIDYLRSKFIVAPTTLDACLSAAEGVPGYTLSTPSEPALQFDPFSALFQTTINRSNYRTSAFKLLEHAKSREDIKAIFLLDLLYPYFSDYNHTNIQGLARQAIANFNASRVAVASPNPFKVQNSLEQQSIPVYNPAQYLSLPSDKLVSDISNSSSDLRTSWRHNLANLSSFRAIKTAFLVTFLAYAAFQIYKSAANLKGWGFHFRTTQDSYAHELDQVYHK